MCLPSIPVNIVVAFSARCRNSCRLLTGATAALTGSGRTGGGDATRRSTPSTLLLTEFLAFVLDHRRSDDLRLAASAFALGACFLAFFAGLRGVAFCSDGWSALATRSQWVDDVLARLYSL